MTGGLAQRAPAPVAGGAARRPLGRPVLGLGWRPEVAGVVAARDDLGFVEVVAESLPCPDDPLPLGLTLMGERGVDVLVHGIGLALGGADRPDADRLERLARAADRLGAPLVSEHLAFVRAGGRSSGHLLPIERSWRMVDVVVENIRIAQDQLPVPLAVEPVAALVEWPDADLSEADFVAEVIERSGALLLLDLANLYVNAGNFGTDPGEALDRLPLERLAYVHVAGGRVVRGRFHDTHADPVWPAVLDLTAEVVARVPAARVMLERDDDFGPDADLHRELDSIAAALATGDEGAGAAAAPRSTSISTWVPPIPHARDHAPASLPVVADGDRADLAVRQQALLDRLTGPAATVPTAGFDGDQLAAARRSLLAKRMHEVARSWPATAGWLGERFPARFAAYASTHPLPSRGGPRADGAAFIATLEGRAGDAPARDEWRRAGLPRARRPRRPW